jgi:hypothetical protein
MRTFNNKKSMVAFNIRPITDYNEVGGAGGLLGEAAHLPGHLPRLQEGLLLGCRSCQLSCLAGQL